MGCQGFQDSVPPWLGTSLPSAALVLRIVPRQVVRAVHLAEAEHEILASQAGSASLQLISVPLTVMEEALRAQENQTSSHLHRRSGPLSLAN